MDQDGYIFLVDRKKELIISGGFNVYPKEIEDALQSHPAVLQAAVVGRTHPIWGETPIAFVVLRPGKNLPDEQQLMTMLREKLADFKLPRGGILFISELPMNAAGKVVKHELKQLYPERFV
jgi:acyl-CoA synthetase (AMP-forming)/AMP-acid ligase II